VDRSYYSSAIRLVVPKRSCWSKPGILKGFPGPLKIPAYEDPHKSQILWRRASAFCDEAGTASRL